MFTIKRTISKFAVHVLVKKVHEIEKDESGEPSEQSDYELTKSRMKTLIGQ